MGAGIAFDSQQVARAVSDSRPAVRASDSAVVVALRAQLEVMREFDQKILTTVYWSLGGLVLVTGLLLGFGWFANFRVYERDKIAMTRDVEATLRESFLEREAKHQEAVRGELEAAKRSLTQMATKAAESAVTTVRNQLSVVRVDVLSLQYEANSAEATRWIEQKVHDNAIISHFRMLEIAVQTENPYNISESLDAIRADIKRGAKLSSVMKAMHLPILEKLPANLRTTAESIRAAIDV